MYKIYTRLWCRQPGYAKQFLRVMKILLILMTAFLMQVSASTFAQKITLNEKEASLVSVFEKINKQSGVDFLVNTELLNKAKPVSIHVNNEELAIVLDKIFEGQPLEYTIKDKAVVVTKKTPTFLERVGALTDMATVMVYNPVKDRFVVMTNAAPRSALTYTLTLPDDYAGTTIHCYISFVSVDGKMASNSTYIAAMILL